MLKHISFSCNLVGELADSQDWLLGWVGIDWRFGLCMSVVDREVNGVMEEEE